MEQHNDYLGKEKISKILIKFSLPCIAGLLISALYNIVDQIFIGNSELGFYGNAATGVSFPIICIVNAFAWCIGDGAASYLSICSGRRDNESAHKCVGGGIIATIIISIILSVLCLIFSEKLMNLFGASIHTQDMAKDYFVIIASFFVFYLLTAVMNSVIRADGSPKYAMIAMLVGAITNIILDPLFIFVFDWGIEGAAWATIIGQIMSFVMCLIYFRKPKTFVLNLKSFKIDFKILKKMISLGTATFITQISISVVYLVSNMILSKYGELSIYGKDVVISVFSIQTKVYTIVHSIVTGIVLGAQPIFGYNYGAGNLDRVKKTYLIVLISTIMIGGIATLIFQLWPEAIINIFGEGSDLYYTFSKQMFRIYLSLMTITCLIKITAVFFQSIGKAVYATISSLIRDIVCFVPLVLILSKKLEEVSAGEGIKGILYAAPIADFISIFVILFLTLFFFRSLKKQDRKKLI